MRCVVVRNNSTRHLKIQNCAAREISAVSIFLSVNIFEVRLRPIAKAAQNLGLVFFSGLILDQVIERTKNYNM